MYIEKAKKERFVSFTSQKPECSGEQLDATVLVYNRAYSYISGVVANTVASLHLTVAYEAA